MRPAEVERVAAKFEELASELSDVTSEWSARTQSYHQDLAAANREVAEARVAGKKGPARTPADVEANLARLAGERQALMEAVDVCGDALVHAVSESRDQWLQAAEAAEAEATEQLQSALADVRAAIQALEVPRQAIPWLESFDLSRALRGEAHHITGALHYGDALTRLEELVKGPEPKHIGWRVDEDGNSEPIYETKDRIGRSFTSVR
jgi:hypothetical protein